MPKFQRTPFKGSFLLFRRDNEHVFQLNGLEHILAEGVLPIDAIDLAVVLSKGERLNGQQTVTLFPRFVLTT